MKQKTSRAARFALVLILVLALAAALSALVYAFFLRSTGEVTNQFTPGESVLPTVEEDFSDKRKENVAVQVGKTKYPVYVRVAIVITWQTEDGIVHYFKPEEDKDYVLELYDDTGWEYNAKDGYYYYQDIVASEETTKFLIKECYPINSAPDSEYTLNVEIITQTVQALGYTDGENPKQAYKDAWGLEDSSGEGDGGDVDGD